MIYSGENTEQGGNRSRSSGCSTVNGRIQAACASRRCHPPLRGEPLSPSQAMATIVSMTTAEFAIDDLTPADEDEDEDASGSSRSPAGPTRGAASDARQRRRWHSERRGP